MRRKFRKPIRELISSIFYFVLAVICLLGFERYWLFGLIFLTLTAFNFYLYKVHKKREEEFIEKYGEVGIFERKDSNDKSEEYNKYLKDIEEEFYVDDESEEL